MPHRNTKRNSMSRLSIHPSEIIMQKVIISVGLGLGVMVTFVIIAMVFSMFDLELLMEEEIGRQVLVLLGLLLLVMLIMAAWLFYFWSRIRLVGLTYRSKTLGCRTLTRQVDIPSRTLEEIRIGRRRNVPRITFTWQEGKISLGGNLADPANPGPFTLRKAVISEGLRSFISRLEREFPEIQIKDPENLLES